MVPWHVAQRRVSIWLALATYHRALGTLELDGRVRPRPPSPPGSPPAGGPRRLGPAPPRWAGALLRGPLLAAASGQHRRAGVAVLLSAGAHRQPFRAKAWWRKPSNDPSLPRVLTRNWPHTLRMYGRFCDIHSGDRRPDKRKINQQGTEQGGQLASTGDMSPKSFGQGNQTRCTALFVAA
jgi:hypothetical protein